MSNSNVNIEYKEQRQVRSLSLIILRHIFRLETNFKSKSVSKRLRGKTDFDDKIPVRKRR